MEGEAKVVHKSEEKIEEKKSEEKTSEEKKPEEVVIAKPAGGRKRAIRKFFHNSETGEYLGRTCLSWAKIAIYYLIFFGFLMAFFCILLISFLHLLNEKEPFYQKGDSIIGKYPGIEYFPMAYGDGKDSDLIWFKATAQPEEANWYYYTRQLDKLLDVYDNTNNQPERNCTAGVQADKEEACQFDPSELGSCKSGSQYGYDDGQPCVFLKVNRIFSWEPEVHSASSLPESAPASVKNAVGSGKDLIYVDCQGEDPEDKANIGKIEYFPQQGFPSAYYPFLNQENYLNPLVAVKFMTPVRNVLINIRCSLWAQNIIQDDKKRFGSITFSLLLDSAT